VDGYVLSITRSCYSLCKKNVIKKANEQYIPTWIFQAALGTVVQQSVSLSLSVAADS
jgi:hypothetical protein